MSTAYVTHSVESSSSFPRSIMNSSTHFRRATTKKEKEIKGIMFNFMDQLLQNQTLGKRFHAVKRVPKGFIIAAYAPNQKNYYGDQEKLNYEWELFLLYYTYKGKLLPQNTEDYTKMRSVFLNGIIKCKCPGKFSNLKTPTEFALWGVHPQKAYRYFLYQCDNVRFLPNWPVGIGFNNSNVNDDNLTSTDEEMTVDASNPEPLYQPCPVGAGQDTGEGCPETVSQYFICNLKVNQDGASEFHILGSITEKVFTQLDSEPNILTIAMSEIQSDGQPIEMVLQLQSMTQPDIVKAEKLMNVGEPVTTATYAAQEPPRSEISNTHFVHNDGLTEARDYEIILKSMAMAKQETVDPEQDPPEEQLAPNQVPCGTEVSDVERQNVSRRWSADTDEGFYSAGSVLSEANISSPHAECETTTKLDSAVKSYGVDESQMDFLSEEFNPMELVNQLCADNQSEANASADWESIDLDQISKDLNKELFDIEMCSVLIPRGQNNH